MAGRTVGPVPGQDPGGRRGDVRGCGRADAQHLPAGRPAFRRRLRGDRGRDGGQRRVGPVRSFRQPERTRIGQHLLRIGQIHLQQPGQELSPGSVTHAAPDQGRTGLVPGFRGACRGPQPGGHLPGTRARPAASRSRRIRRRRARQRGPGPQEGRHQPAGQYLLGLPAPGQLRHLGGGPAAGQPVGHHPGRDLPGEMTEPVGQRRGQVPPVRRLLRRVGRGDDRHLGGQVEITHGAFEDHPQQGRLHGRWRGGQLVQEQQAPPGRGQPLGPGRGREPHSRTGYDREAREVGRLADRRDHRFTRQPGRGRQRPDRGRLAGARCPP